MTQQPGSPRALPAWLTAAVFQFTAGAALSVGLLAVLRTGIDRWLGIFLICAAVLLTLKGLSVADQDKRRSEQRVADLLAARVADELSAREAAERERRAASTPSGLWAWLRGRR